MRKSVGILMLFYFEIAVLRVGLAQTKRKASIAMQIAPPDWFPILLLGIFNTGVGSSLYFSSMGVLPAQSVAVCGYLEPLFAVLLSTIILHETMSPLQIIGAVLGIGGAVFGECYRGKGARPAE